MAEKDIKGDKLWRSAALVVLCGLVYYFSYDHGRQSVRPQLEALRQEATRDLELQRRELLRLQASLAECHGRPIDRGGPLDRIPLRINQSRLLFDGRLVLTLVGVDRAESWAAVQLNFLGEERLAMEKLPAGGSLRFALDGRPWAVVVSGLSLSGATLNLVELKDDLPTNTLRPN